MEKVESLSQKNHVKWHGGELEHHYITKLLQFGSCNQKLFKKQTNIGKCDSYVIYHHASIHPKDHWTLKTGYFEDPTPAIQVQTLPLEGPRSLGHDLFNPLPFHPPSPDGG